MSTQVNGSEQENPVGEEPAVDVSQFAIPDIQAHARAIAHGNTVLVFDTTLRDGEQSPGATLNTQEKLDIAHQLARLGVDIIEAGFPAASPGDLEAVRLIAETVGRKPRIGKNGDIVAPPTIAGLARANKADIDKAWQAVRGAVRPRIHTFIATSDIHMEHKLRMTRDEVLETVGDMVQYARSLCQDVEFSPEDAGRSDPEFLVKVLEVAIRAGATTLNIPDTVGYTTPEEFGGLIKYLRENVPGGKDVIFSVHCHNDLGLATSNTLAGLRAGARQMEVTVNGIGERAGNTSLEEAVMALYVRNSVYGLETNIITTEIHRSSDMVSRYTGMVIQPNKAIVGANAFAHEAGIHQDGVLKHKRTYEIMDAATIGLNQSRLVLGKHSGRHALRRKLEEMGYHLTREELNEVFQRFKEVADKKKTVTDADLEALVGDEIYQPQEIWELLQVQVQCGTNVTPTAVVTLRNNQTGQVITDAGFGTGPVDAVYQGINRVVGVRNNLVEFLVQAVTEGIDANGDVTIRIEVPDNSRGYKETAQGRPRRRLFSGRGVDTDIIVASAKAYMQALNKALAMQDQDVSAVSIAADEPAGEASPSS
ncbi:2-isopropylmalate synthase [Litorilinea aerophila]|uniref:2-isopropylmalate synthase n=1 Tax=Litorilinea aerophila TaxID=1204385 RepID=A0A540VF37_9CHLR|nr:2-isopropylmalate synthase [Litorilinea aerophila]MCC9076895.1 2-isopropylmalate synthase [Litorilinea aerophila]GIV78470.1 MAG: 2-isopropylmalate synthase [Litorilinea sp.]